MLWDLWAYRVLGMAAEVAFWQIVSFPPLLLALVGALGYAGALIGSDVMAGVEQTILTTAGRVLTPDAVDQVVRPAVTTALDHGHAGVTAFGLVLSLWAGSTAMGDLIGTVTIAYDLRALRSPVRTRLLAVLFYVVEVIAGTVVLVLATIGPGRLIGLLRPSLGGGVAAVVNALYWPVLIIVALLGTVIFYHFAIPVRRGPWLRHIPGAVLAIVMGGLSVFLLRRYFSSAAAIGSAAAGIGAIIAVLLFVYFLALSVLVGATFNAEIDKHFPSPATSHVRRPELHPERAAEAQRRGELAEDWRAVTRAAARVRRSLPRLRPHRRR